MIEETGAWCILAAIQPTKKMYNSSTTQPCQAEGRPQPQPFRFAGNQYLGGRAGSEGGEHIQETQIYFIRNKIADEPICGVTKNNTIISAFSVVIALNRWVVPSIPACSHR